MRKHGFIDDQAVAFGEETVKELTSRLEGFVNKTLPMLKKLGGVKEEKRKIITTEDTERERSFSIFSPCFSVLSVVKSETKGACILIFSQALRMKAEGKGRTVPRSGKQKRAPAFR